MTTPIGIFTTDDEHVPDDTTTTPEEIGYAELGLSEGTTLVFHASTYGSDYTVTIREPLGGSYELQISPDQANELLEEFNDGHWGYYEPLAVTE